MGSGDSPHVVSREYFTKAYLRPLTEAGLVARTDPDHPNSPRQKYALTKAGAERIRRVAPLDQEGGAAMRSNAYCGNLLWQSNLTL